MRHVVLKTSEAAAIQREAMETETIQKNGASAENLKTKAFLFMGLCAAILCASSCVSIKISDLKPYPKNRVLLPALEPRVDMHSLESAYSMGTSRGVSSGYATAFGSRSALGVAVTNTTMSKDPRVQDVVTVFDRDVKENITNPYGKRKGYIVCRIAAGGSRQNLGWAFLSGITLLVPNFLGMPINSHKTTLDVEVEIYTNSEELIGKYSAPCRAKSYAALWWGYSDNNAKRMSGLKTFKCAMNDIKGQIERDANRLNAALEQN